MLNWKDWKAVGVQAVDMSATVIFTHRKMNMAIKAVHLMPRMYAQFQQWTERTLGRELQEDEKMEFDGVYIERGTAGQSAPIVIELWAN